MALHTVHNSYGASAGYFTASPAFLTGTPYFTGISNLFIPASNLNSLNVVTKYGAFNTAGNFMKAFVARIGPRTALVAFDLTSHVGVGNLPGGAWPYGN